ncbi:hypothetical protein QBC45DRAFT_442475 [Copromyces sp. CBS 386.78]|nr:hypothetical protein QBC45DRAFT_442475 [Copromyces sp. CBS 386.78]
MLCLHQAEGCDPRRPKMHTVYRQLQDLGDVGDNHLVRKLYNDIFDAIGPMTRLEKAGVIPKPSPNARSTSLPEIGFRQYSIYPLLGNKKKCVRCRKLKGNCEDAVVLMTGDASDASSLVSTESSLLPIVVARQS